MALRLIDLGIAVDPSLRNLLYLLLESLGVYIPDLGHRLLVLPYSRDHAVVGFIIYRHIREIELLLIRCVVVDDRIVHHRSCPVIIDNGGLIDIGYPNAPIIVHVVKIVLIHHHRLIHVCISIDMNIHVSTAGYDDVVAASPVAMAIVRFRRGKGHPSYVGAAMYPGDSSRGPGEGDIQKRYAGYYPCDGWGPIPVMADADPVAVVVRHISERLCRNPCLVAGPVGPTARRKRRPSSIHIHRPPQ
jgi:energy-converting hydrogenase Eha subunit E